MERPNYPGYSSRLRSLDIDATEDEFIRSILSALIQDRAERLEVSQLESQWSKAVTLYGIMDESGLLAEGQISLHLHEFHQNSDLRSSCGH